MLRYALLLLLVGATAECAVAETVTIVNNIEKHGNIVVRQPSALAALLEKVAVQESSHIDSEGTDEPAQQTRTGYRVQVFDDNNPRTARREAEARHNQIKTQFPSMKAYLTFNSPYWRVKVGDFRTRAEAEAAMAELRHAFPSMSAYMRIVRDKIHVEL